MIEVEVVVAKNVDKDNLEVERVKTIDFLKIKDDKNIETEVII